MASTKTGRGYYTESEAAQQLGITLDQLRVLVRRHVLHSEDDIANLPITSFQPSDLLLLKLLAAVPPREEAVNLPDLS